MIWGVNHTLQLQPRLFVKFPKFSRSVTFMDNIFNFFHIFDDFTIGDNIFHPPFYGLSIFSTPSLFQHLQLPTGGYT